MKGNPGPLAAAGVGAVRSHHYKRLSEKTRPLGRKPLRVEDLRHSSVVLPQRLPYQGFTTVDPALSG